jgi:hypothetical protein
MGALLELHVQQAWRPERMVCDVGGTRWDNQQLQRYDQKNAAVNKAG